MRYLLATIAVALSVFACQKKQSSGPSKKEVAPAGTPSLSKTPAQPSAKPTVSGDQQNTGETTRETMYGTWKAACYSDPASPNKGEAELVTLNDDTSVTSMDSFADPSCAQPTYNITVEYSFKLGATKAESSRELDMLVKRVTITAKSNDIVTAFSAGKICGINTWILGQPVDGSACPGFGTLKAGATFYGLVKVSGNQLWFGDNSGQGSGETPEKRPTRLDPKSVFKKQ